MALITVPIPIPYPSAGVKV